MICGLIGYDSSGNVVATLDYVTARDAAGNVLGLVDFEAHELAGGRMRDVVEFSNAVGSGTWPEWLGMAAHQFTVELSQDKRIAALVHTKSGRRRERAPLEKAIADRIAARRGSPWLGAGEEPHASHAQEPTGQILGGGVYIGDLTGGPGKPLRLDADGKTITDPLPPPPSLPVVGAETFKIR